MFWNDRRAQRHGRTGDAVLGVVVFEQLSPSLPRQMLPNKADELSFHGTLQVFIIFRHFLELSLDRLDERLNALSRRCVCLIAVLNVVIIQLGRVKCLFDVS